MVGLHRGFFSPAFTADQVVRFQRKAGRHGLRLELDEGGRRLTILNHRGQVTTVMGEEHETEAGPKVLYAIGAHVYRWQRVA